VSLQAPGAVVSATSGSCFALEPQKNGSDAFVVVLKTDKAGRIPLFLPDGSQPRFWTFEPPLGCVGAPDCGFALLLIDPRTGPCATKPDAAFSTIAAGPSIPVPFDALRERLAGQYGHKKIRVELWPAEGAPDPKHCRSTSADEDDIDFEPTCGTTDAGTDGAPRSDGGRDGSAEGGDARADGRTRDSSSDVEVPDVSAPDAARTDAADDGASRARDGSRDAKCDGPG
jgi:hypothetical protein